MTGTAEQEQNEITTTEAEKVEPIAIYNNQIYALVDDLKNDNQFKGLTDEELKNNKAFFPRLVNYIYNNYIGELLCNKDHKPIKYKNIETLDNLFDIYMELVYKYKFNNRPLIVEFSIFTGISRDTIYNWVNGSNNNIYCDDGGEDLTRRKSDTARKWIEVCERALLDGTDTIKDLFILKCKHGYKETDRDITVNINQKSIISADSLPALIDLKP